MTIFGNICLALAALLYLVPLQLLAHEPAAGRKNDGGIIWGAIYVLVPFWLLLTAALCAATARGALDWLSCERAVQYIGVLASGVALLVLTGLSLIEKFEPPTQRTWAGQGFVGWAVLVFPLVMWVTVAFMLNPALGSAVPTQVYRIPFALLTGVSLLVGMGLMGQWFVYSQKRSLARVEAEIAYHSERDRKIMERVQSLSPTNDFPELLGFANRFENEDIRALAIQKARAHPRFAEELADVLRSGWAEKGLVYLDACDAPDSKALAEPVNAAILKLTEDARDSVARTHTFYAEQFDWNTRIILSAADKFATQGVDYLPAIREFRAALESPRTKDVHLNARYTLDVWLAERAKAESSK